MAAEVQALSATLEEKERQPQPKQRKHFKNRMHLWEFLLELLNDEECRPLIAWTKEDRKEFKITQPERVAQLWGFENNRKNMTYDNLSRALRQYYVEGIIRKVKGQKLAYKFDKLPYEYNPGVTRRRRTTFSGCKISTHPKHGMERGNYSFHNHLNSATNCSGTCDGISGNVLPPYALRSSQFTSLQTKTQLWFPEHARASHSECERRRENNWGTFASAAPVSRNLSPLMLAEEQSAFGNVTPSLATHSRSFITPHHSSSDLSVAEQNASHEVSSSFVFAGNPESSRSTYALNLVQQKSSRNDMPSAAMYAETRPFVTPESSHLRSPLYVSERNALRNGTPSMYAETFASVTSESPHLRSPLYVLERNPLRNGTPSMYAETFATVTPESSHLRSPPYVAEKNASRNGLPSDLAYASVYVPDNVPCPTPVFPLVHRIPHLPLMYVVPVSYDHLPVIASVKGNYSGHPGQDE